MNFVKAGILSLVVAPTTLAATVSWNGSSGLGPESAGFSLFNNSSPEVPTFSTPTLTLQNDNVAEQMHYSMEAAQLNTPAQTIIEFEMAYISGFTNQNFREAAAVGFTMAPGVTVSLFIGDDEVFLLDGLTTRGPENLGIDTNAFHTYRMEVDGSSLGSAVRLYQDNALVLTGETYNAGASTPFLFFGDGTTNAYGETRWQSFSHNAAIPEPSGPLLLLLGGAALARRCRRTTRTAKG